MDGGVIQNQEGVPENHLKRKLAAAVRSIRWSYAIFWSISTRRRGMLEWGHGYYNGHIKTRNTVQPMDLSVDEMDLQRSKQLGELYKSLSAGDNIQPEKRPSAALSTEDLTDAEWYYLVCMSFTFKRGQGMPGRALASGHHIWLCNANYADSKVFTRSLLAKSASIQTVVCFPLMDGVMELGVTELIPEDPALLQHIRTCFSELPKSVCSEQSTSSPRKADEEDCTCTEVDHEIVNDMPLDKFNSTADEILSDVELHAFPISIHSYVPKEKIERDPERIELPANTSDMESSSDSSNGCGHNHDNEDSFMMDDLNSTSQIQYINDDLSNSVHDSMNSSNCTSQSVINNEKAVISSPNRAKASKHLLQDLQECNHRKLSLLDLETKDSHYAKMLVVLFQNTQRAAKSYFRNDSRESSFTVWRKVLDTQEMQISTTQKMLKKVLSDVPWMHRRYLPKSREAIASKEKVWKIKEGDVGVNHALSERRRYKMNEKFLILRSLVPSISQMDKVSILSDTIVYLKELEKKVKVLEACKESAQSGERERRKLPDIVERTSDNYRHGEVADGKKPFIHKRKASDIDETNSELNRLLSKDNLADMTVTINEKEVLIEVRCLWRECLLLEIVEAISSLNLDAHSVKSSTIDGILTLNLSSKFRGEAVASVGMIKHTLQRVVGKCA